MRRKNKLNYDIFFLGTRTKTMDRTGLDPRTVTSVIDDSPISVADVTTVGEDLVEAYPEGLTLATLVPAVKLILRLIFRKLKKKKMTREQKRQFIIDSLRYTIDNTDSGPTLEQLDEVIKEMVPSVVDAFLDQTCRSYFASLCS
ncbi:MAG: hypothetical protein CMF52_05605 [Legionellales bacterium]|nr:hypothetical protein [Legionellales bacterium]|tara:strand:- start:76 stop:507 length:432 start_codon:yes stop_codon:yes gene_type:complete